MRRHLIAGNWKMNGLKADGIARLQDLTARAKAAPADCEVLICPPATLISALGELAAGTGIAVGGQDCHTRENGAFTGDIAAAMLADLGCTYVIVGHSERRRDHGEGDRMVAAKAAAAHEAGLTAIVCVGESKAERDAGRAGDVVTAQVRHSLPEGADAGNTVVAYEPVWAIGTGDTATPADVADIHRLIRDLLADVMAGQAGAVRIIYGGSVNAGNAAELLALEDVDGALVGGASLKPDDFWTIVQAVPKS
jgi:triosephosphate isomerase